jgi:hypothetical protein
MVDCAKVVIGFINTALIITAAVVVAVIYVKWDALSWINVPGARLPLILLVVVVGAALVSAVVGLLSICCSVRYFKILYLSIVIAVISGEISILVGAYSERDKIPGKIEEIWNRKDHQELVDTRKKIEETFKCCGWNQIPPENSTEEDDCGYTGTEPPAKTCQNVVKEDVKKYASQLTAGLIAIATVEFILVIAAIINCRRKPKRDEGLAKF